MILTPDKYQQCLDVASSRAPRISQITQKLFNLLGLNHFVLSHIENSNKSRLASLHANIDMANYWIGQDMPIPLALPNGFYLVSQFKELFPENTLTAIREKCAMDNILFYVQHNHDSTDIFSMAADPDNKLILNKYINHAEEIRKFLLYFKQETKGLLLEAKHYAIDYDCSIKQQKKIFPGDIGIPNYNGFSSLFDIADALSDREFECLKLLSSAKSIKSIARKLKLSPRTVESYLINTKNKLNCQTTNEMLDLYYTINSEPDLT